MGYSPRGRKESDTAERLSAAQWCTEVNPSLPIHPSPFPFRIHTFVLYVCVSVSAL